MLDDVIRYFDLQSQRRTVAPIGNSASKLPPVWPQYLVVAAGVVMEPLLRKYIQTAAWGIDWATLGGRVVFGLVIAIILLPAVYKASFDAQRPLLVQLAALFPIGIGWQTLFTSATKIVVP